MLRRIGDFEAIFQEKKIEIFTPNVVQTLTEAELLALVPNFDGWIIGDDPATEDVLRAGVKGKLRAAVKWGVGVDNVNFAAAKALNLPISNTPLMFGNEVADIALNYVIGLARQTFLIDRKVRQGEWIKPAGISLKNKRVALVGFGDIGLQTAKRLDACGMVLQIYDPYAKEKDKIAHFEFLHFPQKIEQADFIVLTCALTPETKHLLNENIFKQLKKGVRIVNVSRGGLIDETALLAALQDGTIHSAALDVFETEPLPLTSPLHQFENCIFGSHNASNTVDAVRRASLKAIELLFGFLGVH
jgi:D-3-phosphoglycerate dehydrogenase / 2-oxoglutarate reductase